MNDLIGVSDKARERVLALLEKEEAGKGLRLGVKGGGCSGLSYAITFDDVKERDNVCEFDGFTILLDPKSAVYLKGTTLDFDDGLEGKGFIFVNPNASNTCGCGESFSI
jgi:iron-sulfur cluster assembly protein